MKIVFNENNKQYSNLGICGIKKLTTIMDFEMVSHTASPCDLCNKVASLIRVTVVSPFGVRIRDYSTVDVTRE